MIDRYLSAGRLPLDHDLAGALARKPSILQRRTILQRVRARLAGFVETFVEGV